MNLRELMYLHLLLCQFIYLDIWNTGSDTWAKMVETLRQVEIEIWFKNSYWSSK